MMALWLQPPFVHGDIVQAAIDDSLWFRIIVAGGLIWLLIFTGWVMRKMVTKEDILLMLAGLKDQIETRADERFLSRGHERRFDKLETAVFKIPS